VFCKLKKVTKILCWNMLHRCYLHAVVVLITEITKINYVGSGRKKKPHRNPYNIIKELLILIAKHRPQCYCLLRHVPTAPDFRARGIIICMFRISRLWLVSRLGFGNSTLIRLHSLFKAIE